jgi:hypothetical protein
MISPPYENAWGMASYEVCSCCGFEFGFDDNPGGNTPGTSFAEHLLEWYDEGQKWFDLNCRPKDWDLIKQLKNANIPVPDYIHK